MAVTGDSHEQGPGLWHKILVRPGKKTMSLQMLREHMTLEGMAKLYCRGLDDQWPEEAIAPLRNYLQDVPGFDMSLVRTPSAWTEEPRKQHAYLSGQFSETFTTFAETFGDVFAADAGDIDIRDSIHSDRILIVMIPALDTSAHTTSALGRMFITQQSMILARDLGYRTEGTDAQTTEVKNTKAASPISVSLTKSVPTTQTALLWRPPSTFTGVFPDNDGAGSGAN